MNPNDILRALQAGQIELEAAKRQLGSRPGSRLDQAELADGLMQLASKADHMADLEQPADQAVFAIRPEQLGSVAFQRRYNCKWSYFTGSMFRAIASVDMVVALGQAGLLGFFGSTGLPMRTLEASIQSIQSRLQPGMPYGMCLIHNLHHTDAEWRQVNLFLKYGIPVVEAAAFPALTLPLVYYRIKGLTRHDGSLHIPRRIIAKCSRIEVARIFLSPPPSDMVERLWLSGLITEEEKALAASIPMADDLAVEADSGGHTDQGVAFALLPSIRLLKEEIMRTHRYEQPILVGCGGGIGTPEAAAGAFALGADFIFTGSINQCTAESGAHPAMKDILNKVTIHDMGLTVAGDMFELGAKAQVVKKYSQFYTRSNRLYSLFNQYDSLEALPAPVRREIEWDYFKKTFDEVWELVSRHKSQSNPEQLQEAKDNPRLQMALMFKWYFNHCTKVTLANDESEKDNFSLYSGPALGAFNQWAKGTKHEHWRNRHVDQIAALLMEGACRHLHRQRFWPSDSQLAHAPAAAPEREAVAIIGVSGKFPQAGTLEQYWDNLAQGKSCISEIPSSRWPLADYYDTKPRTEGKSYSKWLGLLEEADQFDPLFFNVSPLEAEHMDPQQRLFLQSSWSCIEDAGIAPSSLSGSRTGIFVGCGTNDYGQPAGESDGGSHAMLGSSPSILSARIAYMLNLQGPCIALDTACSSSLVALAQACDSLVLRSSDLALAGGVYVLPGPTMHVRTSQAGMLSADGRCYTFDNRANGFVHGEGVGVVLLKRLSDAVRDGDAIRGVIRGWGVNQDGKTNGITAPSMQAQVELEKDVYRRFGIHPETISLVEAHGTGTKLGDPIEVDALIASFGEFTAKKSYCALGSVKSNIGHSGKAAGIASVIKVLLAMRQRMLPPTINYSSLNEHLSLENSPFYINDRLQAWEWGADADTPRRAAVSSFGFSGTNAHIVLEEYAMPTKMTPAVEQAGPNLLVLSAKTEEQLREAAAQLKVWLERQEAVDIRSVAHTLQTGRDAMEHRLAVLAESPAEAVAALSAYEAAALSDGNWATGRARTASKPAALFAQLWQDGAYREAAQLWVDGAEADWSLLYGESQPGRAVLPTYPFARERYWLSPVWKRDSGSGAGAPAGLPGDFKLHPLVQQNISELGRQRFSSIFTGSEFFFRDHVVHGKSILPGAAYLEMAHAAVQLAVGVGAASGEMPAVSLEHIVWSQPLVLCEDGGLVQVEIDVQQARDGKIAYTISSLSTGSGGTRIVHGKGSATLGGRREVQRHDIAALVDACRVNRLEREECYAFFSKMGVDFGTGHRGLAAVYVGQGQAVARMVLPERLFTEEGSFMMHPGMLDSALQASVGLMTDAAGRLPETPDKPVVPFALQGMEVYGALEPEMWVLVRYSAGASANNKLEKLDIDVCANDGVVRARLQAFTHRPLEQHRAWSAPSSDYGLLLSRPVWKELAPSPTQAAVSFAEHTVIVCEPQPDVRQALPAYLPRGTHCLFVQAEDRAIERRYEAYALEVFAQLRRLIASKPGEAALVQVVVFAPGEGSLFAGLSGLLKTAQLENPSLVGQLLLLEGGEPAAEVAAIVTEHAKTPAYDRIRCVQGRRMIPVWEELAEAEKGPGFAALPWRERGVYLITGGAGGLGLLFAEEIARQTSGAAVVLTGRSALSRERQAKLDELRKLGAAIDYVQADVADSTAVERLFEHIRQRYGQLHGIIHSAGVIADNYIWKKNQDEIRRVLAPKTAGLVHLDRASREMPLDFLVCCSSGAGVTGNPGQADYSAANAFMDAYAAYRNDLRARGLRAGRTLSVNWPLWQDGGMRIDAQTERMIRHNLGMAAMRTPTGFQALYTLLASDLDQGLVVEGDLEVLRRQFLGPECGELPAGAASVAAVEAAGVSETPAVASAMPEASVIRVQAIAYFKQLLSAAIKLPVARIEEDAPLERYGIDSILIMQLMDELEKQFGSLSKTIFFEYQNLREVAGYFIEHYRLPLLELLGLGCAPPTPEPLRLAPAVARSGHSQQLRLTPAARRGHLQQPDAGKRFGGSLDIAIIGLSGKYPGADNLHVFWDNLRQGRDSIGEIPPERWDYRLYHAAEKNVPGTIYSKWGGFLEGMDRFDPLFFNITPKEAALIDPQERLFLQCVYETLEDAGYTRHALNRMERREGPGADVGVYVGVMYEEYPLYGAQEQALGGTLSLIGSPSSIANRVSYWFNFQGPSMAVDTMCSSSLTAIHLACGSLQRGECRVAVAGGVNVSIHPNKYLLLSKGGFLSTKGRCESFGSGGDGYVPGEGVGAVLLKPLERAIADGDHIYGIIKGSAVNHGGKTNGYTVPNPHAQAGLIRRVYAEAGIDPATVSYIEAHGTGTALGDPIEIASLAKVFAEYTDAKAFCAIGSVKSNIGHCESAAGIAGLTKVLLQLQHRQLVPSLHAATTNPGIAFAETPFVVQQELADWNRPTAPVGGEVGELPRRAGVSSFGAGGSNAHLLIEEYVVEQMNADLGVGSGEPVLFVLSAKQAVQLQEQARNMLEAIGHGQLGAAGLRDAAYTLQVGREALEERLALIVRSVEELRDKLESFVNGRPDAEGLYAGHIKQHRETAAAWTEDPDMQMTLGQWLERRKYGQLAELWIKGVPLDWERLYVGAKPCRISLPTYPFARERYWAPRANVAALAASANDWAEGANQESGVQPLADKRRDEGRADEPFAMGGERLATDSASRQFQYLRKVWEQMPQAAPAGETAGVVIVKSADTAELAAQLSAYFPGGCVLDIADLPQEKRDWSPFGGCIDLVGCGRGPAGSGWDAGIAWLQAFAASKLKEGATLLGVTQGLEALDGGPVNLAGATRAALFRLLQHEYGRLRTKHLDVEPLSDAGELAGQIAREYASADGEAEIAYRSGLRYRARLEAMPESTGLPQTAGKAFPTDRVLWITGGTRGLGLLCARHFVRHYGVRKLVLTGREELPPRAQWPALQAGDSRTAGKIRALLELEAQGVQVAALQLDLTDERAVSDALEQVKRTLGDAGGLIHCAGVTDRDNPAFIRKSADDIRQVLAPKIDGLHALHRSFQAEPLQWLLLFSSVAGAVPALGAGQSDYAMANAYMDYFAQAHQDSAYPIVSIQWPNWKESGMGETRSRVYAATGLVSHTDQEGLAMLDWIVAGGSGPVVLPAVGDAQRWQPQLWMVRPAYGEAEPRAAVAQGNTAEAADDRQDGQVRAWLIRMLADEFQMTPSMLDADTPFYEYGMDSILLAQFVKKMDGVLSGVALDPSIFLEYPTVARLAEYLRQTYPQPIAAVAASQPESACAVGQAEAFGRSVDDASQPEPLSGAESRSERRPAARMREPIAIIGMACHFPDAAHIGEYWNNLKLGKDSVREVPKSRWTPDVWRNAKGAGADASISMRGAFLQGIEWFDPDYFRIPEALAPLIDPLQRQWLEVSAEALADAGYGKRDLWGREVGVYVGARSANFAYKFPEQLKDRIVGVGQNFIAAHLAHIYNFKGPNMVVDTACSSALTAIHLAVRALQSGEAELALAGGVEILLDETVYLGLSNAKVLSPDGRCKTFSAAADGIGIGEGGGVLVLKRLSEAIRDRNRIYAVIDGSAINNDGHTMGVTTPNPEAQQELIEKAIRDADVPVDTISYVEAHGTGTLIGDPIELRGLTRILTQHTDRKQFCGVGSVKSNIGHLLSASGAASMIKTILSIASGELPPTLHCEQPNPRFQFADSPLYLVRELRSWPGVQGVRRAGVSSFGLGGNNAHLIVSDEGIPDDLRAGPVSGGPDVGFNRQYFWPQAPQPQEDALEEDGAFLQFFEFAVSSGGVQA